MKSKFTIASAIFGRNSVGHPCSPLMASPLLNKNSLTDKPSHLKEDTFMIKIFAIFGLLSVSCALPTAEFAAPIQADCKYVGSYKLTRDAIEMGIAPDKAFTEKNGIVELKPSGRAALQAVEKIDLGNNYDLILQLDYSRVQRFGDRDFPNPKLKGSALLKYKNRVVSAGSMSSDRMTTQYIDGTGDKYLLVDFELDNVLLREKLGAIDQPGLDLRNLLRDSPEKEQIFTSLGDGDGVVLQAKIHCMVPALK